MDDTHNETAGGEDNLSDADRARFGGSLDTETAEPKYIANFDGDEINGKTYKVGEEIDSSVDEATLLYLTQLGRIRANTASDGNAPVGGTSDGLQPIMGATDPASMDRNAMLAELAAPMSDDDLRRAVEAKRGGSSFSPADEENDDEEDDFNLSEEETAARDKLVADNSKDALLALAKDENVEGVKADNNKDEIATKIIVARR